MAKNVKPNFPPAGTKPKESEIWPMVLNHASRSIGDNARTEHLRFVSFDGRDLRLAISESGSDLARYLVSQRAKIVELVKRATGLEVNVILEEPRSATRTAEFEGLASSLSDRIKRLEATLRLREAQVGAAVEFNGPERKHKLVWERLSGEWAFVVYDIPVDEEEAYTLGEGEGMCTAFNRRSLAACPLDVKIPAAERMVALLQSLRDQEARRIERLRQVHAVLDTAYAELSLKEGA